MNSTTGSSYTDGEEIEQTWNVTFVAFGYVISFVGAYSAVSLLDHNLWRAEEENQHAIIKRPYLVASALLGFGAVWSMHFVGMAAVTLEDTPICYNWGITIGSLAAVIVFMYLGLKVASHDIFAGPDRLQILKRILMSKRDVTHRKHSRVATQIIFRVGFFHKLQFIVAGSILATTGALVMHYTGMVALHGPFRKEWYFGYVSGSVVIGLVVCFAGFWIIFRLRWKMKQFWLRYVSAAVFAFAVCGLHFFGMLGVTYIADDNADDTCSDLVDRSESSPNSWTNHQIVVVAVSLAVPSIALMIENIINRELLLAYRDMEDPDFANWFRSARRRSSPVNRSTCTGSARRSSNSGAHSFNSSHSDITKAQRDISIEEENGEFKNTANETLRDIEEGESESNIREATPAEPQDVDQEEVSQSPSTGHR